MSIEDFLLICRLRPVWEGLACALLCKCLPKSAFGIRVGRASWLPKRSKSKVSDTKTLEAPDMHVQVCKCCNAAMLQDCISQIAAWPFLMDELIL